MEPSLIAVLIILIATVLMLIFEVVRIDVVAILCMLALGWTLVLTPRLFQQQKGATTSVLINGFGLPCVCVLAGSMH